MCSWLRLKLKSENLNHILTTYHVDEMLDLNYGNYPQHRPSKYNILSR